MSRRTFLVFIICFAEILTMAGVMFFPARLPDFQAEWQLTNAQAGWINGIFFGGYALAAPFLVSFTDRIDSRYIFLGSAFLAMSASMGFAWLANGFTTAVVLRFIGGVALAGTYMPGLKTLNDRIEGEDKSRAISFYTACFSIGMAGSVFLTGFLQNWFSWRQTAFILSCGPLVSIVIFSLFIEKKKAWGVIEVFWDFRPVIKNRKAMGYAFGYGVHSWELFGFRNWLVVFLSFCAGSSILFSPQNIATIIMLSGMPASIFGNELARRGDRIQVISLFMIVAGSLGCILGFCSNLPFVLVVLIAFLYGVAMMSDSAALTAGVMIAADYRYRGMTMVLYSLIGFAMAFLGPLTIGALLDFFGQNVFGWGMAFASLGLVSMTGPLWLKWGKSKK